jgi:hypothetical protein
MAHLASGGVEALPERLREQVFLLQPRYADSFTFTKLLSQIDILDQHHVHGQPPLLLQLLYDPVKWVCLPPTSALCALQAAHLLGEKTLAKPTTSTVFEDLLASTSASSSSPDSPALTQASASSSSPDSLPLTDTFVEDLFGTSAPLNFSVTLVHSVSEVVREFAAFPRDTGLSFTPSQLRLFVSVLKNRLQLAWGPPGTGV